MLVKNPPVEITSYLLMLGTNEYPLFLFKGGSGGTLDGVGKTGTGVAQHGGQLAAEVVGVDPRLEGADHDRVVTGHADAAPRDGAADVVDRAGPRGRLEWAPLVEVDLRAQPDLRRAQAAQG